MVRGWVAEADVVPAPVRPPIVGLPPPILKSPPLSTFTVTFGMLKDPPPLPATRYPPGSTWIVPVKVEELLAAPPMETDPLVVAWLEFRMMMVLLPVITPDKVTPLAFVMLSTIRSPFSATFPLKAGLPPELCRMVRVPPPVVEVTLIAFVGLTLANVNWAFAAPPVVPKVIVPVPALVTAPREKIPEVT